MRPDGAQPDPVEAGLDGGLVDVARAVGVLPAHVRLEDRQAGDHRQATEEPVGLRLDGRPGRGLARPPLDGLAQPQRRPVDPAGDLLATLVGDLLEREVHPGGDERLEVGRGDPAEPGAHRDPEVGDQCRVDAERRRGGLAVPADLELPVPHTLADVDPRDAARQVDVGRVVDAVAEVPPRRDRDAAAVRRPLPAADGDRQPQPRVGRDAAQLVEHRSLDVQPTTPRLDRGERVVEGQPVPRQPVPAHVGDVEHRAAARVVEVALAPVDAAVAFHQPGGELEAVAQVVDGAQRLVQVLQPDHVHADPLDRVAHRQRLLADGVEVVGGQPQHRPLVGHVAVREVGQVDAQVVADELEVLVDLQVVGALLVQEVVHHPVHGDPVAEVVDLETPLRDRELLGVADDPPEVDDVGHQRDAGGETVDLGREQRVLVVHALGEADPVTVQEVATVELVGRQRVEEELGVLPDALVDGTPGVEPLDPAGLPLRDALVLTCWRTTCPATTSAPVRSAVSSRFLHACRS